jgi:hypothetical protein
MESADFKDFLVQENVRKIKSIIARNTRLTGSGYIVFIPLLWLMYLSICS